MMQDETVSRPGPGRHRVLLGVWLLASAIILVRAGQIQGVQAAEWRAVAEAQHRKGKEVVAARGSVLAALHSRCRASASVSVSLPTSSPTPTPRERFSWRCSVSRRAKRSS